MMDQPAMADGCVDPTICLPRTAWPGDKRPDFHDYGLSVREPHHCGLNGGDGLTLEFDNGESVCYHCGRTVLGGLDGTSIDHR